MLLVVLVVVASVLDATVLLGIADEDKWAGLAEVDVFRAELLLGVVYPGNSASFWLAVMEFE